MKKAPIVLPDRPSARTRRLVVRPLELRDFEVWREALLAAPPPASIYELPQLAKKDVTRRRFEKMLREQAEIRRLDRQYGFGIFDRREETMYGRANLLVPARLNMQIAWIGYVIYGQHRRKGYATEACEAVIRIAFEELHFHRVEAGIEPGNKPSVALAKRLGMRREGRQKQSLFTRDTWVDLDIYAINAEALGVRMTPGVRMRLLD